MCAELSELDRYGLEVSDRELREDLPMPSAGKQ